MDEGNSSQAQPPSETARTENKPWPTWKEFLQMVKEYHFPQGINDFHYPPRDVWKQEIPQYSGFGALTGGFCGCVLAAYRGVPPMYYATRMAANFGIASFVFFGSETVVHKLRGGKRDAGGYAFSGAFTVLAISLPLGGRRKAIKSAIYLAGVGYGGYYVNQYVRQWRDAVAERQLQRRAALERGEDIRDPNRVLTYFETSRRKK